jgi:amino acid adenylation domain-containing protein
MTAKSYLSDGLGEDLSLKARALLEQRAQIAARHRESIRGNADRSSTPLTAGQEMIWLATQLDPKSAIYNRSIAMRLKGELDYRGLQRALSEVVRRHEVLRSRIIAVAGIPSQESFQIDSVPLPVIDLSTVPQDEVKTRLRQLLDEEARRPFDLATGPFLRAGILRETGTDNTLFISTHHIASDGWSDGVLLEELALLYSAFAAGDPSPLTELPTQFGDFAIWQRERPDEEIQQHIAYWRDKLTLAPVQLSLPLDGSHEEFPSADGGRVVLRLHPDVVNRLESIGREQGATLPMTMLAAFQLLLSRLSGESDVIVGVLNSGRTRSELEGLIGFFSVTLPVRVAISPDITFRELLTSVRIAMLEAHDHREVPLRKLVDALRLSPGSNRTDIAQVLFNFRNLPLVQASFAHIEVHPVDMFNGCCPADLDLEIRECGETRECELRYNAALFEASTASRMLHHFETLLQSVADAPDEAIGHLSILTPEERHQIVVEWNETNAPPLERLFLHEMIETQARATPDATALITEAAKLSYGELDARANALAEVLQSRGAHPGSLVGLCMERSPALIISILATWKAGAAFVPLDTEYPAERLGVMLADCRPVLLVVDSVGDALLGSHLVERLLVDAAFIESLTAREQSPPVSLNEDAVACVLYTSGSTGIPKGVLSTHRGIANNILDMQSRFMLQESDCTMQQTSIGFDAAAWEWLWPLAVGARVFLATPGGQRDPDYLLRALAERSVTVFNTTPSVLRVLVEQPEFISCGRIRLITAAGEVLSRSLEQRVLSRMPWVQLANLYGPSEASITVTAWICERGNRRLSVPIGRPQANAEIYILDREFQPVPVGVVGEIFIGGIAVSNGYLNRPELTAERFLPHPFRGAGSERVYRTGDMARFDENGVIEYVGRRDNQLKIRGVRVELEEIEAALNELPAIRESAVIARDDSDGDRLPIAYIVLRDQAIDLLDIRRGLERKLPPQVIPAAIIPVTEIPRNENGKLERRALPDASNGFQLVGTSKPPRYPLERHLAAIWEEMLNVSEVGIDDSFFDLGGHSLIAVRMLRRVDDEVGDSVSLREFYLEPTIAAMSRKIYRLPAPGMPLGAPPVLKLRGGEKRPPLLYVNGQPPGAGLYALKLPRYLHPDQPVYIVRTPIFDAAVTPEDLAAQLIERIREAVPKGPYVLAGNCLGGWLALEMARQLVAAGERVPLVGILHPVGRVPVHGGFRLVRRLASLCGVPEDFDLGEFRNPRMYTASIMARTGHVLLRADSRRKIAIAAAVGRGVGRYAMRQVARATSIVSKNRHNGAAGSESATTQAQHVPALNEIEVHRRYWWTAMMGYVPRKYPGRILVLWPRKERGTHPWDPAHDWRHLSSDIEWQVVPGTHDSMVREDFASSARALASSIEKAMTA